MTRSSLVGQPLPRHDALGKVTGATPYPADLVRADMLHLKVITAGRAHAQILDIDASAALAHPGVVTVLTAADVPFNAYGLIDHDQPVLCDTTVRFFGDRVALVVAETPEAAARAAALVNVTYEDLPALTDPRLALTDDAPLVHESRGTNLLLRIPIRKGDLKSGFAAADVVIEDEFTTSWQEHAYLQPEAGIAYIDDDGRVVIETAGQWLHEDRRQIAAILRLPEDQVVIRYAAIGGAFGGREDLSLQHLLALAAWKLRRPVAMIWSREESIIGHHKRHPMLFRCKWGASRDGKITAVESEVIADGGAYASTSVEVTKVAALFASGCYEIPNIHTTAYAVYTNNIPSGAFRGFGAPQAQFAAEVMVTRLAHALEIDPITFRRRNIYHEGSIEPTQQVLPPGVSADPVLVRCVEEAQHHWGTHRRFLSQEAATANGHEPTSTNGAPVVTDRFSQPGAQAVPASTVDASPSTQAAYLRRGYGIAAGMKNLGYSFGFPEQSTATVELAGRGEIERAVLRVGAADVGQGSHLALKQIAAEVLEVPVELIELIADDSSEAPNAGSASASRLTLMAGRAVFDAATAARDQYRSSDDEQVSATVQFKPQATTPLHHETGKGYPNYCYGYAAQAVEVEVNLLTGQVQILKVISVHDVGKAINRQQVEGQIEGCLAQAIGYALMENLRTDQGKILTPGFSTYLLPTSLDVPTEIVPIILELADPHGPFGARGMAELPLVPFLPAVTIAIHDAVGVWITEQPFTPERVLAAIAARPSHEPVLH
jgi:CO/xanthine dehydrogenase Mo-binding subunit